MLIDHLMDEPILVFRLGEKALIKTLTWGQGRVKIFARYSGMQLGLSYQSGVSDLSLCQITCLAR